MFKALTILMLVLLIGVNACTAGLPGSSTPTGNSGIEGQVTEGPTCPGPVRIGATECQDKPYQATIRVLNTKGQQITEFQTDVNGYFKVSLSPGTYTLHPLSSTPLPHAADQTVEVTQGQYTPISIVYDTGMR